MDVLKSLLQASSSKLIYQSPLEQISPLFGHSALLIKVLKILLDVSSFSDGTFYSWRRASIVAVNTTTSSEGRWVHRS